MLKINDYYNIQTGYFNMCVKLLGVDTEAKMVCLQENLSKTIIMHPITEFIRYARK